MLYGASSITKDFYVKDQRTFECLKQELEKPSEHRQIDISTSLNYGKEKLATIKVFTNYQLTILDASHIIKMDRRRHPPGATGT